jgi:Zn-dependent protease
MTPLVCSPLSALHHKRKFPSFVGSGFPSPGLLSIPEVSTLENPMDVLNNQYLLLGFIYYLAFLFSTTCHEAAHALAAKLGGDLTAAEGGQVSLNPIPHIRRSPYGMVVFPLLSFFLLHGSMIGFASAPYNPEWARRHPHRAALMALAGPATNFALMLIAALILRVGISMDFIHMGRSFSDSDFAAMALFVMFSLNLLLGVFNLLPVPPLDGSSGIMLFMPEDAARGYFDWVRSGTFAMPGLLVGLLLFRYIFPPVEDFVQSLLF